VIFPELGSVDAIIGREVEIVVVEGEVDRARTAAAGADLRDSRGRIDAIVGPKFIPVDAVVSRKIKSPVKDDEIRWTRAGRSRANVRHAKETEPRERPKLGAAGWFSSLKIQVAVEFGEPERARTGRAEADIGYAPIETIKRKELIAVDGGRGRETEQPVENRKPRRARAGRTRVDIANLVGIESIVGPEFI